MLNKLEEDWIARKQDTKEILRKLKSIYEEITKYSEDRNKINDIDKILHSIRLALTEEYGESCKEISFNKLSKLLEDIKKEIKNKSLENAKKIIDSKESELEKLLKVDILRNCKNIKIEDRYIKSELVEKIKDQIIRWLYENDSQNRY
jgi:phosphoenolpyruvate carboxylase